ncbi:mRNA turnover 4 [Phlyctochytrium planicorne]|nr:mRNA turnover 4 [Phlyctochytrium planicorne]
MPKSKRNKVVNLTKTQSKGKDGKSALITKVRDACDSYTNIYVFHVKNMRNIVFKELRTSLQESSKFFFGSNRVMAKALGVTDEEQYRAGLKDVAAALVGEVGLLFSNLSLDDVKAKIEEHRAADFARGGGVATRTVTIPEGPVRRAIDTLNESDLDADTEDYYKLVGGDESLTPFPNNMETHLRDLGMPTLLKGGVIMLLRSHTICTKGETLTPNQAHLLKHFNLKTATFDITILGQWEKELERYNAFEVEEDLTSGPNGNEMDEDDEEMADDDS